MVAMVRDLPLFARYNWMDIRENTFEGICFNSTAQAGILEPKAASSCVKAIS